MPLPPTLTEGVVTLRAHVAEDVTGVREQCQDLLSQERTAVPVPYTRSDTERFVRETCPVGRLSDTEWAFAVEAEGRVAGTVSLRNEGQRRAGAVRLLLDRGLAEPAWKVGLQVEGAVRRWVTLLREDLREPRSPWLECPVLVEDDVLAPEVPALTG